MDELVQRAMARWPDVPAVFGWLALDRRGEWRIRLHEADPDTFDRITSPQILAFIGRNYACDECGRYFFQNGPQRVYVALDYTPWVVRLADDRARLITHTGTPVEPLNAAWVDETGAMLVSFDRGLAVVLDRDLEAVIDSVRDPSGAAMDPEALLDRVARGEQVEIDLQGAMIRVAPILSVQVQARFGFVQRPAPGD